jgi:hypothetical protein
MVDVGGLLLEAGMKSPHTRGTSAILTGERVAAVAASTSLMPPEPVAPFLNGRENLPDRAAEAAKCQTTGFGA